MPDGIALDVRLSTTVSADHVIVILWITLLAGLAIGITAHLGL